MNAMQRYFRLYFSLQLLILLLFFSPSELFSQSKVSDYAFGDGEKLNYTVSYNWGIIWINAGAVDFHARKQNNKEASGWHFLSTGHSVSNLDWLYKVRDTFEVFTSNNAFQPMKFRRNSFEGGHQVFNSYTFYPQEHKVHILARESKKPDLDTTLVIAGNITDVLTATYLTRSHAFKQMNEGEIFQISMLIDNKITYLPIEYHGKETLRTPNGLSFDCIRFSARIETGTMFLANEKIQVWVSDDENKIPVLIEAKIKVGAIKVHLNTFENLQHPLTSFHPLR